MLLVRRTALTRRSLALGGACVLASACDPPPAGWDGLASRKAAGDGEGLLRILLDERVEGAVRRASGFELAVLAERNSALKVHAEDALRRARDEALSRPGPALGPPEPSAVESGDGALERSGRSNPRARPYQQALSQLNRRVLERESAAMLSHLVAVIDRHTSPEWTSYDQTGQIGPLPLASREASVQFVP
jgi:hypothetical protein